MNGLEYIKLEEVYEPKIIELLKHQENFKLRELFANLVAHVYKNVPWRKVSSGKEIAPNIFQHRLYFAAKESSVEIFLERLCSSLSIQSPLIPQEIIHQIMIKENHMNFFREQTRVFTAYAMKLAREFKERKKKEKSEKNGK